MSAYTFLKLLAKVCMHCKQLRFFLDQLRKLDPLTFSLDYNRFIMSARYYQCSTAECDHEDDESFENIMSYNFVHHCPQFIPSSLPYFLFENLGFRFHVSIFFQRLINFFIRINKIVSWQFKVIFRRR